MSQLIVTEVLTNTKTMHVKKNCNLIGQRHESQCNAMHAVIVTKKRIEMASPKSLNVQYITRSFKGRYLCIYFRKKPCVSGLTIAVKEGSSC